MTARAQRLAALALALACVTLASAARYARAHGGEDHGGAPSRGAAGLEPGVARVPIETQFLIGLRTQLAQRGRVAASIGVAGRVLARPDGDARIAAPAQGRLRPPPGGFPRLGDRVTRGQALALLEPTFGVAEAASLAQARQAVRFAASEAQARLAASGSRVRLAEQSVARLRSLEGVVARRELLAAESDLAQARAELEQARRDLAASRGAAGRAGGDVLTLRAPLDGTVVAASASDGTQVAQGAEVYRVAELSRLWVDARLSEAQAARFDGAPDALVTSTQDPALQRAARRVAVAALVDESTRTVQALFEVDNADGRLRIGASVDVAVRSDAGPEAVLVPRAAVLEREGAPLVVVREGPERFVARPVRLGAGNAREVAVLEGLRGGERVVVEGASSVLLAAP